MPKPGFPASSPPLALQVGKNRLYRPEETEPRNDDRADEGCGGKAPAGRGGSAHSGNGCAHRRRRAERKMERRLIRVNDRE
ncbi:hypothetical protein HMPREF0972_02104 [Actinomyces sp. oral taxon 848 str. F0332]|nr:hypothetical protein HMPREF0972_02104 [Actinomyces sp. oral taxon 848 str. F0332]